MECFAWIDSHLSLNSLQTRMFQRLGFPLCNPMHYTELNEDLRCLRVLTDLRGIHPKLIPTRYTDREQKITRSL